VTKNGCFLKSTGEGVGARVRKRVILEQAKKINGKQWFLFNKHEVLFFPENA
jgi:hypothetical protein